MIVVGTHLILQGEGKWRCNYNVRKRRNPSITKLAPLTEFFYSLIVTVTAIPIKLFSLTFSNRKIRPFTQS